MMILELIGGIGIFMFGMSLFEDALNKIASGGFRKLMKGITDRVWKAVALGTVTTALLHNSALVSLIAIGFVSAGIITLHSAIGLIFGANIGTTFSGWTVALIGFNLPLKQIVFPLIGVAGFSALLFSENRKIVRIAQVIGGFALMFLGLDAMKESVSALSNYIDLKQYTRLGSFGFFVLGTIATIIVQSSTAMRALTMTALFSNILTLPQAMAIIIGSNLGTTSTGLLVTIGGNMLKKQVAFSHVIFNIICAIFGLILLQPSVRLIQDVLGMTSDLPFALAFYDTLFNLGGVLLFLPFMNQFVALIQWMYPDDTHTHQLAIERLSSQDIVEEKFAAFVHDIEAFQYRVRDFNMRVLGVDPHSFREGKLILSSQGYDEQKIEEYYHNIKVMHNKLMHFSLHAFWPESFSQQILKFNQAIPQLLLSAKSLREVADHITEFGESEEKLYKEFIGSLRESTWNLYHCLYQETPKADAGLAQECLLSLRGDDMDFLKKLSHEEVLDEYKIADMLNVSRYTYFSAKAFLEGNMYELFE